MTRKDLGDNQPLIAEDRSAISNAEQGAGHTPLPWNRGEISSPYSLRPTAAIYGKTKDAMQSQMVARGLSLKDAALIVKSVNNYAALKQSHAALLAALETIASLAGGQLPDYARAIHDIARAALSKAGEV